MAESTEYSVPSAVSRDHTFSHYHTRRREYACIAEVIENNVKVSATKVNNSIGHNQPMSVDLGRLCCNSRPEPSSTRRYFPPTGYLYGCMYSVFINPLMPGCVLCNSVQCCAIAAGQRGLTLPPFVSTPHRSSHRRVLKTRTGYTQQIRVSSRLFELAEQ